MKKIGFTLLLAAFALSFNACKKCYVCTFNEIDGTVRTGEEFCDYGKVLDNTLETYDRAGWDCQEQ